MANYRIPKSVSSELKLNKALYLTDLGVLITMLVLTIILNNVVHTSLTWFFYAFMALVAGILIIRPASNPKKRMYVAIYLSLRKRKETYCAIDYEVDESEELNNGDI